VRGAYAILTGLHNRAYHPDFQLYRRELIERLQHDLAPDCIDSDPVLRGFRELHDAVGRSNRRFPASAEALVTLFQRKGLIPSVNPLVDVYNGVSLETRLSLGAHDVAQVAGDITLGITDGSERFVPLGAAQPEPINPGEYCYVDGSDEVLCRLEHRQCEKTKLTADTSSAFYIIQGNANTPYAMLEQALRRLVDLTQRFCGGREEQFWIVD
jgi:DNA/RNA-binding domain of Phe-tRNA-synthetase-like protein